MRIWKSIFGVNGFPFCPPPHSVFGLPSVSHAPVLSGNIFPRTLALSSLLTASPVHKARSASCRQRKERQKNGHGREWKRRHKKKKTWHATLDREPEKNGSESWGPCWLLLWHSPRRWLLSPKNGCAPLLGRPAEINLSGAPSFLSLFLLSGPASCIYMIKKYRAGKNTHWGRWDGIKLMLDKFSYIQHSYMPEQRVHAFPFIPWTKLKKILQIGRWQLDERT